ncbi:MAG: nicotinamide phosphoribosyltransferase domain-containing protein, partial [Deltaproteobacteria bacterium]|nr:nicotinamide phosphoribosyltransferase domain-containing protein [Deltaproteobacteria bacterium]
MKTNLCLCGDSYKYSHYKSYPAGLDGMFAYVESRGGMYAKTLFFGLQAYIKKYLWTPITRADIDEAEDLIRAHGLPFDRTGWEHMLNKHG